MAVRTDGASQGDAQTTPRQSRDAETRHAQADPGPAKGTHTDQGQVMDAPKTDAQSRSAARPRLGKKRHDAKPERSAPRKQGERSQRKRSRRGPVSDGGRGSTQGGPDVSHGAPEGPAPVRPSGVIDLVVGAAFAVLAVFAVAFLPAGSLLRVALVLPALFLAPGYLLLQALPIPIFAQWSRGVHALLAIGISPALVGLLALATALFPGGFRPMPIVAAVTLATLAFAVAAFIRRTRGAGIRPPARTRVARS